MAGQKKVDDTRPFLLKRSAEGLEQKPEGDRLAAAFYTKCGSPKSIDD